MAEEDYFGKTTYFGGPEESLSQPQIDYFRAPPVDYSGIIFGVQGAPNVGYMPQDLRPADVGKISGGTGISGLMGALAPYPTASSMPPPLSMITPANRVVPAPSAPGGTEQFDPTKTATEPSLFKRAVSGIEEAIKTNIEDYQKQSPTYIAQTNLDVKNMQ